MKLRLLSAFLLLSAILAGRTEIILNPGDAWEYVFTTLRPSGVFHPVGSPSATLSIYFNSFPSGALQYELYDFQGFQASGVITNGQDTPVLNFGNVWNLLIGFVRLKLLSGQCNISLVRIQATSPSAGAPGSWQDYDTYITETSPPPKVVAKRRTNAVEISWWTNNTTGLVLESANSLPTNQWTVVPTAPVIVSNRYVVTFGTNESAAYFRLRK